MRELYIEGLAIHDDPNHAWVLVRASAKHWKGHVQAGAIEPRNQGVRDADTVKTRGRQHRWRRYREPSGDPARSENQACTESSCARTGRPHVLPVWLIIGRAAQGTPRRYA
jgi:hypothetical protein